MKKRATRKKSGPQVVTISRRRWSRFGTSEGARRSHWNEGDNYLYCKDGKMCCLGFISRQVLGATVGQIEMQGDTPIRMPIPSWYENVTCDLASINDDEDTSDDEKLRLINRTLIRFRAPCRVKLED